MREETLSTYPNLIPVPSITGTVFKAKHLLSARPQITPMSSEQVLKHQKREGVAALYNPSTRDRDLGGIVRRQTRYDSEDISHSQQPPPSIVTAKENRKPNVFHRLGKKMKKMFRRSKKTDLSEVAPETNNNTQESPTMTSGIHCTHNGCTACQKPSPSLTIIAPTRVRGLQVVTATPVHETTNSWTSDTGFSSDSVANPNSGLYNNSTGSSPIGRSMNSTGSSPIGRSMDSTGSSPIDPSLFTDFDGVYSVSSDSSSDEEDNCPNAVQSSRAIATFTHRLSTIVESDSDDDDTDTELPSSPPPLSSPTTPVINYSSSSFSDPPTPTPVAQKEKLVTEAAQKDNAAPGLPRSPMAICIEECEAKFARCMWEIYWDDQRIKGKLPPHLATGFYEAGGPLARTGNLAEDNARTARMCEEFKREEQKRKDRERGGRRVRFADDVE
ncbi:hypothetical protein CC86DRAFT_385735 [Ophiobolus disseminans]|uniref:Uncharacterized protein n=1 Tax=Ophiobolus disseminans TaxID=1469910 RepID=A0A6A6ZLT7_9PLEO|nr:hypothetical protein CC86DRAFT_385735 [Ophiobolus disseminans]